MALLGSAHLVANSLIEFLSFIPRFLTLQQYNGLHLHEMCDLQSER